MLCPEIFPNEAERLKALSEYGLDSEHLLNSLDPVVRIAARMFGVPIAAVNMIGDDHVFFAASHGVQKVDMRRDVSFCAHAINQQSVMCVPDARADVRFHDNPLVIGNPHIRFYAGVPLRSPDGLALGVLCILDEKLHPDFAKEDCERLLELAKMASDRLELRRIDISSQRTRPAFDVYAGGSQIPVIWFDGALRIVEWNSAAAATYGYPSEDKNRLSFDRLLAESERARFSAIIAQAIATNSLENIELPSRSVGQRKDGSLFQFGFALFGWIDAGGMKFEVVLKDLSQQKLAEDELRRQANQDALTGLANRARFYRCVEESIVEGQALAVLVIDLDAFKDTNDTLGHTFGDAILKEVAKRLQESVRSFDLAARMGGDEFAVLLRDVGDPQLALSQASALIDAIGRPIDIEGQQLRVAASCGLALAPTQAQEPLELVGNADLALFKAKSLGRGRIALFSPELRANALTRRRNGLELHRAVDQGEFLLFYQPQVNLRTGAITGAEALIRWHHPERGLLAPAAFLSSLEGGTLAATVGSWALDQACAQASYWRRKGATDFRIGVNLFGAQFRVGDLAGEVIALLQRHGLPPAALELEITENIVLDNDSIVLEVVDRLRKLGVGVAFDDFGTGYASLSLLKTYPLTRIKIDQSFVRGILESRRDASVIRAILDMARGFELETIAEGIEAEDVKNYLKRERCDEGQGYLFGAAMPAHKFEVLLGLDTAVEPQRSQG